MTSLKEKAIALLGSAVVDLQNGDSKTTVYTVPAGKSAVITHVVIRAPDASLAGGTDFDIGSGANADTWQQTVDLSSMTTVTTDYMVIPGSAALLPKYTLSNVTPDRTFDADTVAVAELADIVGTLINDLQIKYTLEAAGAEFGIKPITGATADATATMDVFGFLV